MEWKMEWNGEVTNKLNGSVTQINYTETVVQIH